MESYLWYILIGVIVGGITFYKSRRDKFFDQDIIYIVVLLSILIWPIAIIVWLANLADLD